MDFNVETATKAELLYMYKNSRQISMQTGLIGHLRADFGSGSAFLLLGLIITKIKRHRNLKQLLIM